VFPGNIGFAELGFVKTSRAWEAAPAARTWDGWAARNSRR